MNINEKRAQEIIKRLVEQPMNTQGIPFPTTRVQREEIAYLLYDLLQERVQPVHVPNQEVKPFPLTRF